MAFKTPNNAARRLLAVIEAIEADGNIDEDIDELCDEESQARVRQKVLREIEMLKKRVETLDEKYEDLQYDYQLDI